MTQSLTAPRTAQAGPARDTAPGMPDTELMRALAVRGSVRSFKPDPLPDGWLEAILEAARRAPTSSNMQSYSIVVVEDPATKAELAKVANGQQHIIDCPVFLALCADLTGPAQACAQHGETFHGHTLEAGLVASVDAALVGMTASLVADSLGLGSVMIGAMRNDARRAAELLGLPEGVYLVFGLCLGWAGKPPAAKPRLPADAVVHRERYDPEARARHIAAYDRTLAEHYRGQGRQTPDEAWSAPIAQKFSKPLRAHLRQQLAERGFPLE